MHGETQKYIGDCLESLLAQMFQDFEVIVVDDCSTDNSAAVVESYAPKFGGRLTLLQMKKNSGGAAEPRNKGFIFSRGEYVFFMDADDLLVPAALAEMYALAKNFNAEVVYLERHFESDPDGKNLRLMTRQQGQLVDKPTLQSENFAERINGILQRDIWGTPWSKFVCRNFLSKNELKFPNTPICEDYLWTLNLFFRAKNFLRVPNALYIWRQTENSSTRGKKSPQQQVTLWLNPLVLSLKWLDETLSDIKIFKDNPLCRQVILDFVLHKMFWLGFFNGIMKISPFEMYEVIKQKFGQALGEQDVLVAALCTAVGTQQKNLYFCQKRIAELEHELASRQ